MSQQEPVDLDALSDLQTPWCIRVVVTLGVAQHIAAGVTEIDAIAEAAGCHADTLHAVLGHLVAKGLFTEPVPGRFALTDAGVKLLDPAHIVGLDLKGIGGRMAYAWGTLPAFVQTGQSAYAELFGRPFWQDLDAHPDLAASFDALIGPTGHGTPDPDLQITGGWASVQTVVDVGGGTGAMLAELLRTHPHLQGTLVDLPRTIARSADLFVKAGVADRVRTAGQSFFDPLPTGADLYLLRHVLNDWPDRKAVAILRNCAEAARPDGRVVVLGGVTPDDQTRALVIEMVLVGGRSSPLGEFRMLADAAGLEVSVAQWQRSEFVVECRTV
jgi:2,7-dihydroxy-5-methyl-1-naphthoate 7-O-methyltransferase